MTACRDFVPMGFHWIAKDECTEFTIIIIIDA
jgi:hypothetical protein